MSAEEELRQNEEAAINNSQFISHVGGKKQISSKGGSKLIKKFSATGVLIGILVLLAFIFTSGNIIPSTIMMKLLNVSDSQYYANEKVSKQLVFQWMMKSGEIPKDEVEILKQRNVLVGYEENGEFIETNSADRELSLKMNNKIISSDQFMKEVSTNVELYDDIDEATYGRAPMYDNETTKRILEEYGLSKNDFDTSFNDTMAEKLSDGSDVVIGTVSFNDGQSNNENNLSVDGEVTSTNSRSSEYINAVSEQTTATTETQATLDSAASLALADTISLEQRATKFYILMMQAFSRMIAGDGKSSINNEQMNYLSHSDKTISINEKGEQVVSVGSPLESPSFRAIFQDTSIDPKSVSNYSSDRIILLTENVTNTKTSNSTIINTVSSVTSKIRGFITRLLPGGNKTANKAVLSLSEPIINSSLENNGFDTIKGIYAGELLVQGAVTTGSKIARIRGGSAADANAIHAYLKFNNTILAMDAAADRLHRSPFDITSKNTFLGSIVYKFAMSFYNNRKLFGIFNTVSSIINTTKNSIIGLIPGVYADDINNYLSVFGDCRRVGSIGAEGSVGCSEIDVFDPSTLNDPFNNPDFIAFTEKNTELNESGTRIVKENSDLENYIKYNNERVTPLGVTDGGILESLSSEQNSSSISLVSNLVQMVKSFINSPDSNKKIATGEAFLNSASNPKWQTYKYAQRYVSLAKTIASLREFSSYPTAFNNIQYFEGEIDPVTAFTNHYHQVAER